MGVRAYHTSNSKKVLDNVKLLLNVLEVKDGGRVVSLVY